LVNSGERAQHAGIDFVNLGNRFDQTQPMAASKALEENHNQEVSGGDTDEREGESRDQASLDQIQAIGMGGTDVQLNPSNNPVSRSGTGNSGPANTTGGAASYSATGSAPGSAAG